MMCPRMYCQMEEGYMRKAVIDLYNSCEQFSQSFGYMCASAFFIIIATYTRSNAILFNVLHKLNILENLCGGQVRFRREIFMINA